MARRTSTAIWSRSMQRTLRAMTRWLKSDDSGAAGGTKRAQSDPGQSGTDVSHTLA